MTDAPPNPGRATGTDGPAGIDTDGPARTDTDDSDLSGRHRRTRGPTVGAGLTGIGLGLTGPEPGLTGHWPGLTVTDPRTRPLGFLGACVGAFALAALVPPVGGVAGAAFLLVWFLASAPYAVAFGTITFAALAGPASAAPPPFVLGLGGFGTLAVLADALRTGDHATDLRATAAFVLAAVVLLAVVGVATTATDATWLLAVVVVAVGATLAYGAHRYERVTMGLVGEDEP